MSEMETAVEDLQWDIEKLRKREQKLNKHLAEALEQVSFSFISEIIHLQFTCNEFVLKFIIIIVFAHLSALPLRKEIVLQDIILQILLRHLQLTVYR